MRRSRRMIVILTVVAALVVGGGAGPASAASWPPPGASTYRLAGESRYETAVRVSQQWFGPGATLPDTIYLASGESYADALSVAPVASLRRAPLLLVPPGPIPAAVAQEIARLGARNIAIAGGPGAVSEDVARQLASQGLQVTRIAGTDRYDTSRRIIEHGIAAGVFGARTTAVFVVTGRDYPDALAAGAVAGNLAAPVLLTDGRAAALLPGGKAVLEQLPPTATVLVVGGEGAVSNKVFASIPNRDKRRVAGSNRYETSRVLIDSVASPSPDGAGGSPSLFAAGTSFPDALAGAAYAGATGMALWVIPSTCIPQATADSATRLRVTRFGLLGGNRVLAPSVDSLTICAPAAAPRPAPTPAPSATRAPAPSVEELAAEVVRLVNAERAAAGCPALRVDERLTKAAQLHSEDMVAGNYVSHYSLDGRSPGDRIAAQGYPAPGWGENIARGQGSPAAAVKGWMNSPGHRANILECAYVTTGVGVAIGAGGAQITWTQVFAMN